MACGEELQELEHSDFYTEGPTVEVGSLLNNSLILQVYSHGLKLLSSGIIHIHEQFFFFLMNGIISFVCLFNFIILY